MVTEAQEHDNDGDDQDADETAKKAKEIGDAIGTEEDDYEIQEEADDEDDSTLGKNAEREAAQEEKKKERRELSNREKRQLRKQKINQKFSEKDERIAAAEARAAAAEARAIELERRQTATDARLNNINKAEIENGMAAAAAEYAQAEQDALNAFNEGDGVKNLKSLQRMAAADERYKQLNGIKQQLDKVPEQAEERPKTNPRVVSKAQAWAARNPWYNTKGGDVDSEIAKTVSGVIANEGFDPATDDFWDELDDRLSARLPDKYEAQDDDEDEAQVAKPKKRASPPVGGGSSRGDVAGKKTIKLKTSFVNNLKESGIWDDPVKRKRAIDSHLRIVKEQEGRR